MSTFTLQQPIEIVEQEWTIPTQNFTLNSAFTNNKTITIDINKPGYTPIAIGTKSPDTKQPVVLNFSNHAFNADSFNKLQWSINLISGNKVELKFSLTARSPGNNISRSMSIGANSKIIVMYYKNYMGVISNVN